MMKCGRFLSFVLAAVAVLSTVLAPPAAAQTPSMLNVYGPGGPAPAMREAAQAFGAARGITVNVVAGPTAQWAEQAKADGDLIYSGAEYMFTDFEKALPGVFAIEEVYPLYLRPVAILVRPGNPKKIRSFRDIVKPGIKVLTVAGAGQIALWEDVAGRTGDIRMVRALRSNIVFPEAANSAAAREQWIAQPDIDVWLIWNIWQVSNPTLADVVPMDAPLRVYRDTGVVLTAKGKTVPAAVDFVEFLKSPEAERIFVKWGWSAN
jgi:accessory colonization factor AcfC